MESGSLSCDGLVTYDGWMELVAVSSHVDTSHASTHGYLNISL